MRAQIIGSFAAVVALFGCAVQRPGCAANCSQAWMDANLHVNDIVTVGTHNSYKQAIDRKFFAYLTTQAPGDGASR
jgi:hypothetical protein